MGFDCGTLVIGGGLSGLSCAGVLARAGQHVVVLEQNRVAGGCASSFYRQGHWFESGATTLVGLDPGLPLAYLRDHLGLEFEAWPLALPMRVVLADGREVLRYQDRERWPGEAERVFGKRGQRAFWNFCYDLSDSVWRTALRQRAFPPSSPGDLLRCLRDLRPEQLRHAPLAFGSLRSSLRRFGLANHIEFVSFINEQLMITAQNTLDEVNPLFAATALCYTNLTSYYLPGGFVELARAFVTRLLANGGRLDYRTRATTVRRSAAGGWVVSTDRREYQARQVVFALPVQNTLDLLEDAGVRRRLARHVRPAGDLWSAFTMGLVFARRRSFDSLHHQLHLDAPLPGCPARSLFVSLSHPEDRVRAPADRVVAAVSAHVAANDELNLDTDTLQKAVIQFLIRRGFFEAPDLLYSHCSTPRTWREWTLRKHGAVGGTPQFRSVRPWQMQGARLGAGLYQCGDTTYPGQGVPAVCLSGLIAAEKILRDTG